MNIPLSEFQHSFQTYFENCVINNLARAELADIREAIEILDKNDILFKNRHISMAFIIRIGSVIENGLREFYMAKCGLNSIQELKKTDNIFNSNGIFQRLKQTRDGRDAISIFKKIGISTTDNVHYKKIA